MDVKILPMSPQAHDAAKGAKLTHGSQQYPFDTLEPGQCFTVALDTANIKSVQAIASKKSNDKTNRSFKVIKHKVENILEVARIR